MNNNFYFINSFSNIYKKPSKLSEVTSQIIYGEKFKILSKNKNWVKIKTSSDNYIGYLKNPKYLPMLCGISTIIGTIPTAFLINSPIYSNQNEIMLLVYASFTGILIAMTAPNMKVI